MSRNILTDELRRIFILFAVGAGQARLKKTLPKVKKKPLWASPVAPQDNVESTEPLTD
jgi:hypothetical protein